MFKKMKTLLTTKDSLAVIENASHKEAVEKPETIDILSEPTTDISEIPELAQDIPINPEAVSAFFDDLAESIDFVVPDILGNYLLKDELLLGLKIIATISGVWKSKDDTSIDEEAKKAAFKVILLMYHFGVKKVVTYITHGNMILSFAGRQLVRFLDGSSPDFVDRQLILLVKKLQNWR